MQPYELISENEKAFIWICLLRNRTEAEIIDAFQREFSKPLGYNEFQLAKREFTPEIRFIIQGLVDKPSTNQTRPNKKPTSLAAPISEEAVYGKILGLRGKVTIKDVRKAYRDEIAKYHPDKVSHLGERLRKVAEEESKQINEAYQFFIRKYENA